MRVLMFSPHGGYGLARDEEDNTVFFPASVFERLEPGGPPPILGEEVLVLDVQQTQKNHPRANRVLRRNRPRFLGGIVKRFDAKAGWGFVVGDDGSDYFLHRSDIATSIIPVPGKRVLFYPCLRNGKPRACHVTFG